MGCCPLLGCPSLGSRCRIRALRPADGCPPPPISPAGNCSDTRTRFLGTRPPKLFAAAVRGERSMLALSSRPWLGYSDQGKFNLVPMSYEALDYASGEHGWCRRLLLLAVRCFCWVPGGK